MSKAELYRLLNVERELVIDEASGHVVKRDAWERIDFLLDCLSELNAMGEVVQEPVEVGNEF